MKYAHMCLHNAEVLTLSFLSTFTLITFGYISDHQLVVRLLGAPRAATRHHTRRCF